MSVINSKYLPTVHTAQLETLYKDENYEALLEALVEPLHEELYKRQTFDFLDDLSQGQQMILSFDYVRTQVLQGGFIQLIQNGYIRLLLPMPAWFSRVGLDELAQTFDDVLKVYVMNIQDLDKETTVEEFAKLYEEFKEFEELDARFTNNYRPALKKLVEYAMAHLPDFVEA